MDRINKFSGTVSGTVLSPGNVPEKVPFDQNFFQSLRLEHPRITRSPHMKQTLEDDGPVCGRRIFDLLQKHSRRRLAHLVQRLRHGTQHRFDHQSRLRFRKAHHRNLLRNLNAAMLESLHGSDGQRIVESELGVGDQTLLDATVHHPKSFVSGNRFAADHQR